MLKTVLDNPWVRAAGALLALACVGLLCYLLRPVLVPLFLAFLVAYAVNPVVDFFERRKISRTVTIGCMAVIAMAMLVSIPLFLMPRVISEADGLISAAQGPAAPDSGWAQRIDALLDRLPLDDIVRELGLVEPDQTDFDARAVLAGEVGRYTKEHASQLMKSLFGVGASAGKTVANVFTSIGRGAVGLLAFMGNFVLFAFVTGYLLRDFHSVVEGGRNLVPPRYRPKTFDILHRIDIQIRSFLRGQAVVCLCLGIMYIVGLSLSGVPFAIVIGALGGVVSFVPYLGLILTIGPALLLALLQHGIAWNIAGVAATFVVAQSIEGSLLTPKIVGDQVGLNPVWVILAIMVFSGALGFLGLLLAVPMAAALKVLVVEAAAYYKRSAVFEDGSNSSDSSGPA